MQINEYDRYLSTDGPVALLVREQLLPIGGQGSPIFPPTFAPEEGSDAKPDYVIDSTGEHRNIALIDSVGSQANRLEPIFKRAPFAALVPQIEITIGERKVNLLEAGHRAADAIVRYSEASETVEAAFAAYDRNRDATALAKLNPTALVFGVWDSRGSQAKFPRLVSSTVRATDVARLQRSAQYISQIEKEEAQEINSDQKALSSDGLSDAPSGRSPGGVVVRGEIVREAVLNLIPLRSLQGKDAESTLRLQRYIFGLTLVAFTAPAEYYLRQGCLLTGDPGTPYQIQEVTRQGKRSDVKFDDAAVLTYAQLAAKEFGVGESFETSFSTGKAKAAHAAKKEKKAKAPK